jgi:hypothetical protein
MAKAFIAATVVSLALVAAAVVTLVVAPIGFGSEANEASLPAPRERVIAVDVPAQRKAEKPRKATARRRVAPAPAAPSPGRVIAQTPARPRPNAVTGAPQPTTGQPSSQPSQPQQPAQPQAAPEAPATPAPVVEARGSSPAQPTPETPAAPAEPEVPGVTPPSHSLEQTLRHLVAPLTRHPRR